MRLAPIWLMKRVVLLVVSCAVVLLVSMPRSAADEIGYENEITISGEVLDLTCYLAEGKKGSGHKACAKMCAKKGLPMGLMTDSGEIYLLIENHDDPDPYDDLKNLAGTQVELKAVKYTRDGMSALMVLESKGS